MHFEIIFKIFSIFVVLCFTKVSIDAQYTVMATNRQQYPYVSTLVPKKIRPKMDRIVKKIGGSAAVARGKLVELGLAEYERRLAEGKE